MASGAEIENMYGVYHRKLYAFIRSKVKDTETASDLLQETFLKAQLNLSGLKDQTKLESWLYQIARNMISDFFRKQKNFSGPLPEVAEEPADENINQHFTACLSSFIHRLPQKYKEAVRMADLENMNQGELAKKLNISYSGAKSRIQRGRALLKSYMLQCCDIVSDKYGNIISEEVKSSCKTCNPSVF
jgi:RNA polymerase sigma-70 factor (ECF subfamily)